MTIYRCKSVLVDSIRREHRCMDTEGHIGPHHAYPLRSINDNTGWEPTGEGVIQWSDDSEEKPS